MDDHGSSMAGIRVLRSNSRADGMNRKELVRDMKGEIGSFPSTSQIAKYMRVSRDKVRNMVAGLEYIEDGKSKRYFVNDVVGRLLEQKGVN